MNVVCQDMMVRKPGKLQSHKIEDLCLMLNCTSPCTNSAIKIENRSEKISKKPKISVCTLFSNLDNILKVLMYPLGAFSIMTSFLFDFPSELHILLKK